MRVRVRFRYNADTGEVEAFVVEDIGGRVRSGDHDAVHDAITADVARVVERNALIEEVTAGGQLPPQVATRRDDEAEPGGHAEPEVATDP